MPVAQKKTRQKKSPQKTLMELNREKHEVSKRTGHYWGIEELTLQEKDPAKFERFVLRLNAASASARETAKHVSASPLGREMGELLFGICTPDGDAAAASQGLCGHIGSMSYIMDAVIHSGVENDISGFNDGDVFFCNDPASGTIHPSDQYTLVPVFYKGQMVAWANSVCHIVDSGAITGGSLPSYSGNTFMDGFIMPPTKIGENLQTYKWWDALLQRRTRSGILQILDSRMRLAGCGILHKLILEIVEEFGVDYFSQGMKEILELEARRTKDRVRRQLIPAKFQHVTFKALFYKGFFPLHPESNKNWLLQIPGRFEITKDSRLIVRGPGLSSQDWHAVNGFDGAKGWGAYLYWMQYLVHSVSMNSVLRYFADYELPKGSIGNASHFYGGSVMAGFGGVHTGISAGRGMVRSFFARGYMEESAVTDFYCQNLQGQGVLPSGIPWAFTNSSALGAVGQSALPYRDGWSDLWAIWNCCSDLGNSELWEFLSPPVFYIGQRNVPNYFGHGKFRGSLGTNYTFLILDPGPAFTASMMCPPGSLFVGSPGMSGGYPGLPGSLFIFRHTNSRELIKNGVPLPRDFEEIRQYIRDGKLKVGETLFYRDDAPDTQLFDGDIISLANSACDGWGDALERDPALVQNDLRYGWITPDVAKSIYGVVAKPVDKKEWKIDEKATSIARQRMMELRRKRAVPAREWWAEERKRVSKKEFPEMVYEMYKDSLKQDDYRREFLDFWQLSPDYKL